MNELVVVALIQVIRLLRIMIKKSNQLVGRFSSVAETIFFFHRHFCKSFIRPIRHKNRVIPKAFIALLVIYNPSFADPFKYLFLMIQY